MSSNWKQRNPDYHKNWRHNNIASALRSFAKQRAKSRGIEFNIDKEDLTLPEHCPILGLKLEKSKGARKDNSPSIDRVDNTKGYVKGNVQIISWRANRLKNDATLEELEKVCEYLRRTA